MKRRPPSREARDASPLDVTASKAGHSSGGIGGSSPTAAREADSVTMILALAFSAIALGISLQYYTDRAPSAALACFNIAFLLCIAGIAMPRLSLLERLGEEPICLVLGLGLILQFCILLSARPGLYLTNTGPGGVATFIGCLVVAAVLSGGLLTKRPWLGALQVPLLLASHFVVGCWLIQASPQPFIDVYVFQKTAIEGFLGGSNPYTMSYPNIYGARPFYAPELVSGDRVLFGFYYLPLSLLMLIPGQILGGDFRYSQLAAYTLAGGLLAYARPGRLGALAAALLLFTPRSLFILEQAWTEPFLVLFLAATVFACCRRPKLLPWAFGLFLGVKQYAFLAIPALAVLPQVPDRAALFRVLKVAVLLAAAITLPWLLWSPERFLSSVVLLQFRQPFRADSLGYLAWVYQTFSIELPVWVAFVALVPAVALAWYRAPRTSAGFAASVAIIFFCFFAFNKMGFTNYHFFVLAALCTAVGAAKLGPDTSGDQPSR